LFNHIERLHRRGLKKGSEKTNLVIKGNSIEAGPLRVPTGLGCCSKWETSEVRNANILELSRSPKRPLLVRNWRRWLTFTAGFSVPAPQQVVNRDRVLLALLFVDIVESTMTAVRLGDRAWAQLLHSFYDIVRENLAAFRGQELDTAGDGVACAFAVPTSAIHCAFAIRKNVTDLGLQIRAGLHAGECERLNGSLAGVALHIGARIGALATTNQVLVSNTVKDLVEGSDLRFIDYGRKLLRGVPGEWRLFLAEQQDFIRELAE
jgi:class 3 adenylate cyclase